jgi:hypothetical protein
MCLSIVESLFLRSHKQKGVVFRVFKIAFRLSTFIIYGKSRKFIHFFLFLYVNIKNWTAFLKNWLSGDEYNVFKSIVTALILQLLMSISIRLSWYSWLFFFPANVRRSTRWWFSLDGQRDGIEEGRQLGREDGWPWRVYWDS